MLNAERLQPLHKDTVETVMRASVNRQRCAGEEKLTKDAVELVKGRLGPDDEAAQVPSWSQLQSWRQHFSIHASRKF